MSLLLISGGGGKVNGKVVWAMAAWLCAGLFAGCSSIPKTPARLYNLNNGQIIKVQLYYFNNGRGTATAVMPDGTVLKGKYSLVTQEHTTHDGKNAGRDLKMPPIDDAEWARLYGYGGGVPQPVGYGSLTDDAGFTLQLVLYSVDRSHEYGTGLGRDSRGTWYRVHVGKLDGSD